MPTVEKTHGGRVHIRSLEQRFEAGDRADVSEDEAAYLCDDRGDFARVGEDGDNVPDDPDQPITSELVNDGVCPWCDDYEGDAVPQHASSAHPGEWDAYRED